MKLTDKLTESAMRKTIAVIFLAALFFLAAGTLFNFVNIYRGYVGEFHGINNLIQALTFRDNKPNSTPPAPPQADTVNSQNETKKTNLPARIAASCTAKSKLFRKITFNIEDMYTRYFYKLDLFVDGHGLVNKLLRRQVIYVSSTAGYYRAPNNYLYHITETPLISGYNEFEPTESDIENLKQVIRFKEELDKKGIDFLFVYPAIKEYPDLQVSFEGVPPKQTGEKWFTDELEKNGVPVLSCTRELDRKDYPLDKRFYRTDHHWRQETGFALMPEILESLNLLPTEKNDFRVEDYFDTFSKDQFFVGSTGRNVGRFFCTPDDFTWYHPKKETNFKLDYIHRVTHEKKSEEGRFEDVIVTSKNIDPKDKYANRYGVYLGVDLPETWIHNTSVENERKIIVVKTSHAAPIVAYLSCFVRDEIVLDFRHLKPEEGTLSEITEIEKPDTVVIVAPTSSLSGIRY